MKKLILAVSIISLITFNSCSGTGAFHSVMSYNLDPNMPNLGKINAVATMDSVGFEWKKIPEGTKIQGIYIYRGDPLQATSRFQRIGTINNIYATHFVDTHVDADNTYSYVFTTFNMGRESVPSERIDVRTPGSFPAISLVLASRVAHNIIKVLWKPHPDPSVESYVIERSVNNGPWMFLNKVKGRLMVEYIDKFARSRSSYSYRIIAETFNKIDSAPSDATAPVVM